MVYTLIDNNLVSNYYVYNQEVYVFYNPNAISYYIRRGNKGRDILYYASVIRFCVFPYNGLIFGIRRGAFATDIKNCRIDTKII